MNNSQKDNFNMRHIVYCWTRQPHYKYYNYQQGADFMRYDDKVVIGQHVTLSHDKYKQEVELWHAVSKEVIFFSDTTFISMLGVVIEQLQKSTNDYFLMK